MIKTYDEIFDTMKNYFVTNQNKVTDLNEGSVIASIFEAVAREISAEYVAILANVDTYQKKIAFAQFDFQKKAGLAATGSVVFTRNPAFGNNIDIPAGTEIATTDGVGFVTMNDVVLSAGELTSEPVIIQCKSIGTIGNVAANTVSVMTSIIPGITAVTNESACAGGVDEETDDEYSNRFRQFILGLGQSSVRGIKAAVLGINGIKSCSVVEHFPPVSGYNFTVYAEDGTGTLPQELLNSIQTLLDGDATHTGIRAAGLRSRILAPTIVMLTVTVFAHIDWSIPQQYIEDEIKNKITGYVLSLGIGEAPSQNIFENLVKGQYGIVSMDGVEVAGMPDVFDATMIARISSIDVEFV